MNVEGWPVMPAKCGSCPFGPNGERVVRATVEARVFSASQVCHHPRITGRPESHLCRGSRDHQLAVFHRLGWLPEPTDAAFDAVMKSYGLRTSAR